VHPRANNAPNDPQIVHIAGFFREPLYLQVVNRNEILLIICLERNFPL
jgi:hypothetical protein